jgi:uncharacterized protein YndB with AHSA1/START domain
VRQTIAVSKIWAILSLSLIAALASAATAADKGAIVNEAVIDGPAGDVWRLITTKDGMESWIVPHAEIDLRVGGLMRTNHDPNGTIGDSKTITNRILAIVPKRMFSLQVAGVPAGYPFAESVRGTWYEISLSPLPRGQTRVRCVGRGFGNGPVEFAARAFVDKASAWELGQLQKVFADRKGRRAAK